MYVLRFYCCWICQVVFYVEGCWVHEQCWALCGCGWAKEQLEGLWCVYSKQNGTRCRDGVKVLHVVSVPSSLTGFWGFQHYMGLFSFFFWLVPAVFFRDVKREERWEGRPRGRQVPDYYCLLSYNQAWVLWGFAWDYKFHRSLTLWCQTDLVREAGQPPVSATVSFSAFLKPLLTWCY